MAMDYILPCSLGQHDIHALRGAWDREQPKLLNILCCQCICQTWNWKTLKNEHVNSDHKNFFPPNILGSKCNFTCLFICMCHWCSGLNIVAKGKTPIFAVTNNFETDGMHFWHVFPLPLFKWRKNTRKKERINFKFPLMKSILYNRSDL